MKQIANLLFETAMLKNLNRSGYAFLGTGKESVAEHSFMTAFICFVMAKLDKNINEEKLLAMALVHDIAEARTGDFNYVQKKYSKTDEKKAIRHLGEPLFFGTEIKILIDEFNANETLEAKFVNDADQISFVLELKKMQDTGAKGPEKWLPYVIDRLQTDVGKNIAETILDTGWDEWWLNGYRE